MMLANLHHAFALQDSPDLPFEACYCYGTSTSNQRIESWWAQWTRTKGHAWGDYFRQLQIEGLWSRDCIEDRIALLAVFMPIIKADIKEFVDTWNFHKIRKQKNRPWVVHGKPWMNYYYPQHSEHATGLDYGTDVEVEELQVIQRYVDQGPGKRYPFSLPPTKAQPQIFQSIFLLMSRSSVTTLSWRMSVKILVMLHQQKNGFLNKRLVLQPHQKVLWLDSQSEEH